MSGSGETASKPTSGQQESASVYDLIYRDASRIALFLSQFDPRGLVTALKHTQEATETFASKTSGAHDRGPRAYKNTATAEAQEGGQQRSGLERSYDPQWRNALVFLDYLTQRDLIVQDLSLARIGQFILASGSLSILDASFMKDAWPLTTVSKLIRATKGQTKGPKPLVDPIDLVMDLLKVLPHPLQAQLDGPGFSLWCGLAPENLVTSPSDILLKHGTKIAGVWHVLGVLDAEPDHAPAATVASALADAPSDRLVASVVEGLAPMVRTLLGRQPGAHGATPLLIFREVSGRAS